MRLEAGGKRLRRGLRRWEHAGLRTMTAAQIYDAAFAIYRRGGGSLIRLTLIPSAIVYALSMLAYELVGKDLLTTGSPENALAAAGELGLTVLIGVVLAAPPVLAAYALMLALVAGWTAERTLGREPDGRALFRQAVSRLPSLMGVVGLVTLRACLALIISFALIVVSALMSERLGAQFVAVLGIVGLFSAPVIMLYVFGRLCLAPVIVFLEGLSPRQAIARSRQLLDELSLPARRLGRGDLVAVGLFLLTLVLQLIFWWSFLIPTDILQQYLASAGVAENSILWMAVYRSIATLAPFAAFVLLHPVLIAGVVLLYYDRRIRVEGLDIQLLAQNVWQRGEADFEI
ncbi:MAG: hypothetical protein C4341_08835 [Armatimonadota bacterium]